MARLRSIQNKPTIKFLRCCLYFQGCCAGAAGTQKGKLQLGKMGHARRRTAFLLAGIVTVWCAIGVISQDV